MKSIEDELREHLQAHRERMAPAAPVAPPAPLWEDEPGQDTGGPSQAPTQPPE